MFARVESCRVMYGEELPPPDFRATLSDDELMLQAWHPGLVPDWGAVASLARTPDSPPIADLSILRDAKGGNELIVTGILNAETPVFTDALCSWAASLGYTRVWLADRLVTLDPFTSAGSSGCAEASCRSCRRTWRDSSPMFWQGCIRGGFFPLYCMCCGATLPQWSAASAVRSEHGSTTPPQVDETARGQIK
jgi:hypothetical protein